MTSAMTEMTKTSQASQPAIVIRPIRIVPSSGCSRALWMAGRLAGTGLPPRLTRAAGTPIRPSKRAPRAPRPRRRRIGLALHNPEQGCDKEDQAEDHRRESHEDRHALRGGAGRHLLAAEVGITQFTESSP